RLGFPAYGDRFLAWLPAARIVPWLLFCPDARSKATASSIPCIGRPVPAQNREIDYTLASFRLAASFCERFPRSQKLAAKRTREEIGHDPGRAEAAAGRRRGVLPGDPARRGTGLS